MNKVTVISGAFGTGKTEIAINTAINLKEKYNKVILIDLDIVNLYFRSRQKAYELEKIGIEVVSSQPGLENADLPALSPRIEASFLEKDAHIVIDLGGSDLGATALSRFRKSFFKSDYEHLYVVNPYRPFNETEDATLEMADKIEKKSDIPITGIIANPHLLNETNDAIILEGLNKVKEITKYPLKLVCVMKDYFTERLKKELANENIMVLEKQMKQPWEEGGIKI